MKIRKEIYIMVDIEADGPIPSEYNMNSIGAAAFAVNGADGKLEALDPENPAHQFYAELKPHSPNFIPAAIAVGGFTHEQLMLTGATPENAMKAFVAYAERLRQQYDARPIFVGYPLGFDWIFTYWYLMKFVGSSPFGFSSHRDLKTEFAIRDNCLISDSVKSKMPRALFGNKKHTHNALDDAIEQADLAWNIMNWDGNRNLNR
jgi:3' exoribonuclease, RNase T-like